MHVRELAVAKGVLQFASKASLRDANALLDAYKVMTFLTCWRRSVGTCLPAAVRVYAQPVSGIHYRAGGGWVWVGRALF